MTLITLIDDDDDIKIEYVEPKCEQLRHSVIKGAEIVAESELQSAGINFTTKIDIEEDTKPNFDLTAPLPSHENVETTDNVNENEVNLSRKLKCSQCRATFRRKDALNRHVEIHVKAKKGRTCNYCSKTFSYRNNFMRHMKTVHVKKESKIYECYVCSATYKKMLFLKNHITQHFDRKTFQCNVCSKKFPYQSALTKHVRRTHEDKDDHAKRVRTKYQCTECPFTTTDSGYLKKHCRKHTGVETGGTLQPVVISCKLCEKTFSSNSYYRQHMRNHLKLFKCDSCPKGFGSQYKLDRHLATHQLIDPTCPVCHRQVKRGTLKRHMRTHVTEKCFKCDECPRAFSLEVNLKKHQLRHVVGNKYQCYMCPFASKTLAKLRFHFTGKHVAKIFKCKVCFKQFLRKEDWSSHETQHTSGTYSCDFCPKTFPFAEMLKRHMQIHNKAFECNICFRVLSHKGGLDKHIRSVHNAEKSHKCEICLKMFSDACYLKRHIRRVHLDRTKSEVRHQCTVCPYVTHCEKRLQSHYVWHSSERPFTCLDCPKTFKTRNCVVTHIKGCHSKEPKIYKCNKCPQTFSDRSSRLKHKKVHIEPTIFQCSICPKQETAEFRLKLHMNLHTQPFHCNNCSSKFSSKGNLDRHQKTHGLLANGLAASKIKYECYICGRTARNENTLKLHFAIKHTGERPYKCNVCTSTFTRPDYLRLHQRIHTGEKPFECTRCSRRFSQRQALRAHIIVHEKIDRGQKVRKTKRKYKCFRCEFCTVDVSDLVKHSRSHGIELAAFVKLNKLPKQQ